MSLGLQLKRKLLFTGFFFVLSCPALACWGFRPMGMGGAFVAVADDANLAYWNRAGAAQLNNWQDGDEQVVLTTNVYNSNGFFAREPRAGNTYYDSLNYAKRLTQAGGLTLAASWSGGGAFCFSPGLAVRLPWPDMSVGLGYFLYRNEDYVIYNSAVIRSDYIEHEIHLDYLWRFQPEWSFGLHIESFWLLSAAYSSPDDPSYNIKVHGQPLSRPNYRPAIAWTPEGKLKGLVVNAGIYDLAGLASGPYYSGGLEYSLLKNSFRLGYYNYKSQAAPGFLTFGYGYKPNQDWELGYWGAAIVMGTGQGKTSHNLGLAIKF